MINEIFKNKYPFVYNYFSVLLKPDNKIRFPQSIILESSDTKNSYYFALELARILNCKQDKMISCACPNCKWIKSYSHPAVNNVSQIHFKGDDDKTETQISVKQAAEIEKSLNISSDYHRFFIFFSSKKSELQSNTYGYNDIDYTIEPLTAQTFNRFTINSMLKFVEEPPKNTTFVFLTKSKEDILPTIVSRSQVFKLSSIPNKINYSDISIFLSDYFNLDYIKAIKLSDDVLDYINNNNVESKLVLEKIIAYLKDILNQNDNIELYNKINRDIDFISESIRYLRANVSDKITLEALFLKIARGY